MDYSPELVVNAAGFAGRPNVDACESQKRETFKGNVVLPLNVAETCSLLEIPWAHISSGCMYNGPGPYRETDPSNFSFEHPPCSWYSGTKVMAERLVEGVGKGYLWRLRLPFDEWDSPRNYLTKLMNYPRLVNVTNSISHRLDFVKACLDLWRIRAPFGTYNMTNPGAVCTSDVVRAMARLGFKDSFQFFDSLEEFNQTIVAPRTNCTLDTSKLSQAGVEMRPVWHALEESLRCWRWADQPRKSEVELATPGNPA